MSKMRQGECPQCGSSNVHYKTVPGAKLMVSFWSIHPTYIYHYVCTDCGYMENYIHDSESLNEIAKKWDRAAGRKKKNDEG